MEENKKTQIKKGFFVFLLIMAVGLWVTTQDFAQKVEYNHLLGHPFFMVGKTPYYAPWAYIQWWYDFYAYCPNPLYDSLNWLYGFFVAGMFMFCIIAKKNKTLDTHGTASWATFTEMCKTGLFPKPDSTFRRIARILGFYENTPKPEQAEGVILGRSPYGKQAEGKNFLRHDGPEHIICMAPTRSGKGVGIIIPTLLTWRHSVFVLDLKGENWGLTAGYRQKHLKNKVLKFDPTAQDGSSARYNPLAEIRLRTKDEVRDVQNICDMLVDPKGEAKEDHWSRTAHALLVGVILHLCYVYQKEDRGVPTLTDVATYLSCPGGDIAEALHGMQEYAHISHQEFLSTKNIFEEIYGDYFSLLKKLRARVKGEQSEFDTQLAKIKQMLKTNWPTIKERVDGGKILDTGQIDEGAIDDFDCFDADLGDRPMFKCLTHPKVAEASAEIANKPDDERGSVISTALSFLTLYRDPVVAANTRVSDFCIEDLMRDDFPVSLYLVVPPGDLPRLTPLLRMIINILLSKLTAEMKFKDGQQIKKKQRCLLLLDEFPVLGQIMSMEKGLAYIAGYGLKALIIVQSLNQLNKSYTKENSIVDNCHVRIFFTPNDSETPGFISKMLGKKTINVASKSGKIGAVFDLSESISQTGRELMTAEEVGQLSESRSIAFVTGNKPIMAVKIFFFKEKFFLEKTKINAPSKSDVIKRN